MAVFFLLLIEAHHARLGHLLEVELDPLASQAALLQAADVEFLDNPERLVDVLREDAGVKAVAHCVGLLDRLAILVEPAAAENGI
jgi:hypothetical protein